MLSSATQSHPLSLGDLMKWLLKDPIVSYPRSRACSCLCAIDDFKAEYVSVLFEPKGK